MVSFRMVHGLLQDRHNEFFIQQTPSQVSPPPSPYASASSSTPPQQQPQPPGEDTNAAEWHQGFQVSMQALPPGVTVTMAESILFVGKAVRVLQRPTGPLNEKSHDLLPHSDAISFAQALRQLQQQDVFDQIGFERTVELIRTTVRLISCSNRKSLFSGAYGCLCSPMSADRNPICQYSANSLPIFWCN